MLSAAIRAAALRSSFSLKLAQQKDDAVIIDVLIHIGTFFLNFALLPVFDTTFPGKGGGWNRAGARHRGFIPPRVSRSCVQEYHCKLTGS